MTIPNDNYGIKWLFLAIFIQKMTIPNGIHTENDYS